MSQFDQHLTIEQLSTLLDDQPYAAAQVGTYRAHLQTCEPCQSEFAELRQTVSLLRALPQPALPRSFVLPADFSLAPDELENEPTQTIASDIPRPIALAHRRRHPSNPERRRTLWATMRIVSSLVATIGLFLSLSGLLSGIASIHLGGTATSASSTANNGTGKNGALITPEATKATPVTSSHNQPAISTQSNTIPPRASSNPVKSSPPPWPTILLFDLNTSGGRFGLGILLVVLGSMGFSLFKQRTRSRSHTHN